MTQVNNASVLPSILLRWALLCFLCGVGIGSVIPYLDPFWLYVILLGCGVIAVLVRCLWRTMLFFSLIPCLLLGIFRIQTDLFSTIQSAPRGVTMIHGMVREAHVKGQNQRLLIHRDDHASTAHTKEVIQVTTGLYPEFSYGDKVAFTCTFNEPRTSAYTIHRRIGAQCFTRSITLEGQSGNPLIRTILAFMHGVESKMLSQYPPDEAALLAGLIFGDQEYFSEFMKNVFSHVGISHIVVASGSNIAYVLSLFIAIGIFSGMGRRATAVLGSTGILMYLTFTGFSSASLRAGVMACILLSARLIGRRVHPFHLLLLACSTMVAYDPRILVFDVSFQLSCAAMLGLLFLPPLLERHIRIPYDWARELMVQTVAATLATAPVIIYYFGSISLIGLPLNLLVLPLVPIILGGVCMWGVGLVIQAIFPLLLLVVTPPLWLCLHAVILLAVYANKIPFMTIPIADSLRGTVSILLSIGIFITLLLHTTRKQEYVVAVFLKVRQLFVKIEQ